MDHISLCHLLFQKGPLERRTLSTAFFQSKWFSLHPWLHYVESNDSALCHVCMIAAKQKKVSGMCSDQAFVTRGYCNWKDVVMAFKEHEESKCHKESTHEMLIIPSQHCNVGEMLSGQLARQKAVNRQMLYSIISSIQYLVHQGLPLRGDGNEEDGNFSQLMKLNRFDAVSAYMRKMDHYGLSDF